jgi:hypothetical protein
MAWPILAANEAVLKMDLLTICPKIRDGASPLFGNTPSTWVFVVGDEGFEPPTYCL